jgi:hypothetical protein
MLTVNTPLINAIARTKTFGKDGDQSIEETTAAMICMRVTTSRRIVLERKKTEKKSHE